MSKSRRRPRHRRSHRATRVAAPWWSAEPSPPLPSARPRSPTSCAPAGRRGRPTRAARDRRRVARCRAGPAGRDRSAGRGRIEPGGSRRGRARRADRGVPLGAACRRAPRRHSDTDRHRRGTAHERVRVTDRGPGAVRPGSRPTRCRSPLPTLTGRSLPPCPACRCRRRCRRGADAAAALRRRTPRRG